MEITRGELQKMLDCAALRAVEQVTGSGMISQREAGQRYGKYFLDAVKDGRIKPVQVGKGENGKKSYRVSDIVAMRAYEMREARLQIEACK